MQNCISTKIRIGVLDLAFKVKFDFDSMTQGVTGVVYQNW